MLVRPLILSFIFIVVGVGKRVYTADNKTIQWHVFTRAMAQRHPVMTRG